MGDVRVSLLGPVEAHRAGASVRLVPRERALLAMLALAVGRPVTSAALIAGVWGENPPASSRNAVQVHVSGVRRALGGDVIRTEPGGYRLDVAAEAVDTVRFERLSDEGASQLRRGRPDVAAELLRRALALWRGEALSDCGDLPFAQVEADRLEERRLVALEHRLDADVRCGRGDDLVEELVPLRAAHPFRERIAGALMMALFQAGRQADALAAYRWTRDRLVDELGVEPGPELRRIHAEILGGDPAVPSAPYFLGRPAFGRPPTPPAPLIARAEDLTAIQRLLGHARLVTLLGPGGVGKTHLAMECARSAASRDGLEVFWASLAELTDAPQVLPTIAQVLGLRETTDRSLLDLVLALLADRRALLVLDNVEHLLPDAAVTVAPLLAHAPDLSVLATSRAALRLSAEHRYEVRPLAVPPSHALASPDEVAATPACALFLAKARAVRPSLRTLTADTAAAVAELTRRLDGLPLALELAAARTNLFTPATLLARLERPLVLLTSGSVDAAGRHRSLRAAVQWSHDLLTPAAQRLLAGLSIFRGGFTLAGAKALWDSFADPDTAVFNVFDVLDELVDASLIGQPEDADDDRFQMLETIRDFADEQLADPAERRRLRQAHAAFVESVVAPDPLIPLVAPTTREAHLLTVEQHNVLAATTWTKDAGDHVRGARLTFALAGWLMIAGLATKADTLLATVEDDPPDAASRARAIITRAIVATWSGRVERSVDLLGRIRQLPRMETASEWRAIADAQWALMQSQTVSPEPDEITVLVEHAIATVRATEIAFALAFTLSCGGGAMTAVDTVRARTILEEAVAHAQQTPSHPDWIIAASNLAELELSTGNADAAKRWAQTAATVDLCRWAPAMRGYPLDLLGASHLVLGEFDRAEAPLREALTLAAQVGDTGLLYEVISRFAALAAVRGQHARARNLLTAYLDWSHHTGSAPSGSAQTVIALHLAHVRDEVGRQYRQMTDTADLPSARELVIYALS